MRSPRAVDGQWIVNVTEAKANVMKWNVYGYRHIP